MVIPATGEAEWLPRLHDIPTWQPANAPMVVVVPHPDDETLAAGGLIAAQRVRGIDVTILAVTDGEHAYTENEGLAEARREEQARALARLGVARDKIIRLGLADRSVTEQQEELAAKLQVLVKADTQLLAPWHGDFHPDHEACARAAEAVARRTGATLISYFFWTWHRGAVSTLEGLPLVKFALTEETRAAKREALACHVSQLKHAPEPEILPENLLWPARLPFEIFAL